MNRIILLTFVLALVASAAFAQSKPIKTKADAPPIEDNSFLIEEAFNQEYGVVQHITTFMRLNDGSWVSSFTQEWPASNEKHQLSYTLLGQRVDATAKGFGDMAVNYRYGLVQKEKLLVAPRVSALLPTGSARLGTGAGAPGLQVNLPVSIQLSKRFITHLNAGATWILNMRNADGDKANTRGYNLGHSLIWLANPRFNVVFETAWTRNQTVVGPGQRAWESGLLINPGVRWSHNFRSGMQIVPGIAFPIGVGPSRGERSVFLYLSVEHMFRKPKDGK